MNGHQVRLIEGMRVLVKTDIHFSDEKGLHFGEVWVSAIVSEIQSYLGDDDLIWVDYIDPMIGSLLTHIPEKREDIKPYPETRR